jgi:hypothetical protein
MAPPTFKPDDIELIPDAWGQFERAVDTVSKSGPQHRSRLSPPQQTGMEAPSGGDWLELGFDTEPGAVGGQPEGTLIPQDPSQTERHVNGSQTQQDSDANASQSNADKRPSCLA